MNEHGIARIDGKLAILTISDTRTVASDKSGQLIQELAYSVGFLHTKRMICKDDQTAITQIITEWLEQDDIQMIITTGGTGIAKRDCSIESIQPLFEKEIPGFGEIFRYLSFTEDVGTKALLSRATAGVSKNKMIYVLPGSTGAVRLAMTKLILPELDHVLAELKK